MHSLKKLYDEYPEFVQIQKKMNNVTQIQTPILSAFYGQNGIPRGTNMTWLRELDTDEFLRRTYSDVKIVGCQFGSISCVNKWALKKTLYGYCMEGSPSTFGNETEKKETENAMSISILLTYNLDNWSPGGWAHYLEGTVVLSVNCHKVLRVHHLSVFAWWPVLFAYKWYTPCWHFAGSSDCFPKGETYRSSWLSLFNLPWYQTGVKFGILRNLYEKSVSTRVHD